MFETTLRVRLRTEGTILHTIGKDSEISPTLLAHHIQRAIAEKAVELALLHTVMARVKLALPILEKFI